MVCWMKFVSKIAEKEGRTEESVKQEFELLEKQTSHAITYNLAKIRAEKPVKKKKKKLLEAVA